MYIPPELIPRGLYSPPPPPQDSIVNNPTLLVSWWCTGFALVIILVRLSGRYIRTEKLFKEDRIMALSILPLLARMAFVHIILRWGTNNTTTTGLSPEDIWHREVGSRLVLPARILYAAFLWTAKLTICEFLKRLCKPIWKSSYQTVLQGIRYFLLVTFVAVVLATLLECHPFSNYWQVVPDPGPQCRQGYAQLITMGVSDVITDLVLIIFPIPIVLSSSMRVLRKLSLILLFGLSSILVGITIYRVYATIQRQSNQQFRSLMASLEILAAAAVSNALVLGSFVRDRGVKKQKFKFGSTSGGSVLDRPTTAKTRPQACLSWGSDTDLVSDLGLRLGPEFSADKSTIARPAPAVLPLVSQSTAVTPAQPSWTFPGRESDESADTDIRTHEIERDVPPSPHDNTSVLTPRRMSFFDVGGLLGDSAPRRMSGASVSAPSSATYSLRPLLNSSIRQRSPRGSRVLLEDVGGIPDDRPGSNETSSAPASSPRVPF